MSTTCSARISEEGPNGVREETNSNEMLQINLMGGKEKCFSIRVRIPDVEKGCFAY